MTLADIDPHAVAFDSKRMLGIDFSDSRLQREMLHWPFPVVRGPTGAPLVELRHQDGMKLYRPEELSAIILRKAKQTAEAVIGTPVTAAVVTVPAYFSGVQRQATEEAARLAGFAEFHLLNEPSAAAIAYGMLCPENHELVLVFDLGGANFDVSVVSIQGGSIKTLAVSGQPHLGGADFDKRLVESLREEFERNHKKRLSRGSINRLRCACEQAKRMLSSSTTAEIALDGFEGENDFRVTMTRARFEHLCMDYFE